MAKKFSALAAAGGVMVAVAISVPVWAQKQGGILRQYMIDSPASMSIHEEATIYAQRPMMAVFNNLLLFDQHVKQNTLDSIVPDLATGWSWNEDGTELTFPLRQGVKWHDGKPFTAADVKCTWDRFVRGATTTFAAASTRHPTFARVLCPGRRLQRCVSRSKWYFRLAE